MKIMMKIFKAIKKGSTAYTYIGGCPSCPSELPSLPFMLPFLKSAVLLTYRVFTFLRCPNCPKTCLRYTSKQLPVSIKHLTI